MADILLTHCNHLYFDRKQVRKMQPYPPLQTLIAAALLRREGFDVALFDSTLEPPEEGFRAALARHQPRLVALCEDNFNFLTKMCLTRNRELAFSMCRAAKGTAIPVLVSSSDATDHAETYLSNGVDYVMVGELEDTLLETARCLLEGHTDRMEDINGLVYRDWRTGAARYNRPRGVMAKLDLLPLAAWDLIDVAPYRHAWMQAHGYFSLNMVSSRGCPYHCNWCAKPIYGQSYHYASPDRIAREMQHLKTHLRPDHIWFADDIFALSTQWTAQFAEAVENLRAQIPFKMQSRCDLMTRPTVAALRRAGCSEVWMGAESGSQRILDAMDKGIRLEQIHQARENLRRHEIAACFFLQFGYPGEDWEDIQSTIRLVRETEPDDIGVSVAYPLPGTKFHERVVAQLGEKKNWLDSDDLAMMFRGTYTNDLYHALHDALHLEVDLRKSKDKDNERDKSLRDLWARVEELRTTCANPDPTVLWTSS
jgi:anaerobic magnesium-protoporphyrin IX monomethyl ester cyclase